MNGRKLYVGGLPYSISDRQLEELFSAHGTVESARVIIDRMSGRSRGFGFVEMSSQEEAQAAVRALRYPPEGERGIAGRLWTHWVMSGKSTSDYIKEANKETLLVAMIEDAEGISQISEILTVDGLDCVFIGRADLSVSLGIPGLGDHPKINEAVDTVLKKAANCGKAVGIGFVDFGDPDGVKRFIQQGAQLFSMGTSAVLMKTAHNLLTQIKGS